MQQTIYVWLSRSLQPSVTTRRKRRKNRDRRNTLACGEKLVTGDLAVAGDEALASDKSTIRGNKNRYLLSWRNP